MPDPIDRLRRLPAVRGAGRGAHRRRRVPAGRAAGAARPDGRPASAATSASWATRSTCATPPRCCCRRTCRPAATSTRCCAPSTRSCDRLATDGLEPTASWPAPRPGWRPTCCATPTRCSAGRCSMAVLEQQRGEPGLLNELPRLVGEVTEEQVRAAAATLRPQRRAVDRGRRREVRSDDDRTAAPRALPRAGGRTGSSKLPKQAERTLRQRADRDRGRAARRCRWSSCGCGCRSAGRRPAPAARPPAERRRCFSGTADDVHRARSPPSCRRSAAALSAGVDPDRLLVSGNGLVTGLDRMLEILAEVLTGADLPERRGRHRAGPAGRPDPGGAEPAGAPGPGGAAASGSTASTRTRCRPPSRSRSRAVRPGAAARAARRAGAPGRRDAGAGRRHRRRSRRSTRPSRRSAAGTAPARAADAAAGPAAASPARCCWSTGPARCSPRCGSALPAVPRTHPDHAALQLANLVFGGYFSSRWVENIREDKGYTYGPHSVDRALGGRLGAGRRRRGGHRGDRARRCWRRCTSWAGWPRLPPERGRAGAGPAVRPGHAAARHVHPGRAGRRWPARTPASGCGWTTCAEHAAPAGAATRERGRRGGGPLPGAGAGGHRGARRRRAGRGRRWRRSTAGRAQPSDRPSEPRRRASAGAPPLARSTLDRAAHRRDRPGSGWPRRGSGPGCWWSTRRRRPGAGPRPTTAPPTLVLLDRPGCRRRTASGCSSASSRTGCRSSRSTRRCRRCRAPGRRTCARSGTCSPTATPGCSPPRWRWPTGTPRHRYSPVTGQPTDGATRPAGPGSTATGEQIWPRTDPAMIVLVHDGVAGPDGRCLLGNNAAWPRTAGRAPLLLPGRLRRAGGVGRGGRGARGRARRSASRSSDIAVRGQPGVAVPRLADARLPRHRRPGAAGAGRPDRDRGRPLVHPPGDRRGAGRAAGGRGRRARLVLPPPSSIALFLIHRWLDGHC